MGKRRAKRVTAAPSEDAKLPATSQTELLIMRKIAELEQLQDPLNEYRALFEEIEAKYDESELCREFDSEIIDESKSPEERIDHVRSLFMEKVRFVESLYDDCKTIDQRCKKLMSTNVQLTAKLSASTREYENVLRKQELLEEMARVSRLQNRQINEETENFSRQERDRMANMTQKFTGTLEDITQKLSQQETEQRNQSAENEELRSKLAQFQEHFDLREQHFTTQLQTRDLEVQLLEAKCQQQQKLCHQEKAKADAYKAHISQLSATEKELNSQLALYANKFEHFQEALSRSNVMFKQFKEKMDKMAETIERLSAENKQLRAETQKSDMTLIQVLEEKQELTKQISRVNSTRDSLGTTCHQLQNERTSLKQEVQVLEAMLQSHSVSDTPVRTAAVVNCEEHATVVT